MPQSTLNTYLTKYEHLYPGIDIWWKKRVIPDVESGIKRIQIIEDVGLAVFDRQQAKLCHLSVVTAFRGQGYGKQLLKDVTLDYKFIWCTAREDIAEDFVSWSDGFIEGKLSGDEVKIIMRVR